MKHADPSRKMRSRPATSASNFDIGWQGRVRGRWVRRFPYAARRVGGWRRTRSARGAFALRARTRATARCVLASETGAGSDGGEAGC